MNAWDKKNVEISTAFSDPYQTILRNPWKFLSSFSFPQAPVLIMFWPVETDIPVPAQKKLALSVRQIDGSDRRQLVFFFFSLLQRASLLCFFSFFLFLVFFCLDFRG